MKLKRALIDTLDRNGGRWLLSAIATQYARNRIKRKFSVWYDELWIRSLDSRIHFVDTSKFEYYRHDFLNFPSFAQVKVDEPTDYWFHTYRPRKGDLILDVGAGVGFDTLVFSRSVGPSGRVIAIEANPRTFQRLEKFCKLNELTNTVSIQNAVVDRTKDVYIEDGVDHEANRTLDELTSTNNFKVQGLTLDQICKEHKVDGVDFLKMNIEGAEQLAILGMTEMIRRTKYACIACHDFRANESITYATRDAVIDFLVRNRFRVSLRTDDSRPYVRDHVHAVNEMIT